MHESTLFERRQLAAMDAKPGFDRIFIAAALRDRVHFRGFEEHEPMLGFVQRRWRE